ncbi:MAG: hypothetical protein JSS82_07750 [Bacteroidetes bacterium]|nr:hypothetical protein [Bacteroidota bacterium]
MRKIGTVVMVTLIGTLAFTSCKKNHTCACNIHIDADTTGSMTIEASDTTVLFDLGKTTKGKAKSACDADQTSQAATWADFGAKVKCDLQ